MLMNCHEEQIDCSGKEDALKPEAVFEQLKINGVAEEGCNNYYANTEMSCSQLNKCKDCENGEDINKPSICSPKRFF